MVTKSKDYAVAIIPPSGDIIHTRIAKGAGELKTLQEAVGGYIELVTVIYGVKRCVAFVNEEGRLKNLEFNERASNAYRDALRQQHAGVIVGTMIVCLENPS
jgi:Na+/alanine symporter